MFFSRYQGVNSITLHFMNFIKFQTLFEIMLQHSQLSSGCYYYLVVLLTVVSNTQTSSAKFSGFFCCYFFNVPHMECLQLSNLPSVPQTTNFLCPGGVRAPVLRAVNRKTSGYGKDMDSILKFIGRVDVHDNTQISMLSVLPFKCIYHLGGSSFSFYLIRTDKTVLISCSLTSVYSYLK